MIDVVSTSYREWNEFDGVTVCGFAFDGETLLSEQSLCTHFADVETLSGFADALDALDGFFAVALEGEDGLFLGVDHVRSIPLLYAPEAGLAGDDAAGIRKRLGDPPNDPLAESELLAGGTVLDNRTLVSDLFTVRPGEAVELRDGEAETERYFEYCPTGGTGVGDREARERLHEALDTAFDRFVDFVGDRQVALSLSGGTDSRLLATELARRDCDVLAYSFGRPDCADVTVAAEIAAALDIPWTFVEYTMEGWREWYCSPEREAFVAVTTTDDSIPNYGLMPALAHLREVGLLDDDAVCTAGQTVVGMSENVPDQLTVPEPTVDSLRDAIVDYWARWQWDNPAFDRAVRERIADSVSAEVTSLESGFSQFERWKMADRHVKYFIAEARQYDFHGLSWWYPLWDRELVAAWEATSFSDRRGKQLYTAVADERFTDVAGVSPAAAAGTVAGTAAPSLAGRAFDGVAETLADSPIAPLIAPVYWWLQRRRSTYGDHPLAWYGMIPPDLFARLYSGREDVHTLQTLDAVDRASFLDGTVTDPPKDGVLSLPYDGRE